MISYEQFMYTFKPLAEAYKFTEYKLALIYPKLNMLPVNVLERVVNDCLMEHNFAPTMAKIVALAKDELDQLYEQKKQAILNEAEKNPCYMCKNSGWVEVIDTESTDRYRAAFGCTCEVGMHFVGPNGMTRWSEFKFYPRFLPDYKVRHSMGGGTVSEHIEEADKIHYERLGKVMGSSETDVEKIKAEFMKLPNDQKIEIVMRLSGS